MKHPVHRHPRRSGSEWLSAIFTLLVLTGIYSSMDSFSSYSSLYDVSSTGHTISISAPYWNEQMGYGFHALAWDSYTQTGSAKVDHVTVVGENWAISMKDGVKVAFYRDIPIADIEKSLDPTTPRAYSRLPNGIAVITGNLDSPSAKTILATIHSE